MLLDQQVNEPIISSYFLLPFNLRCIDVRHPYLWSMFDIRELKVSTKLDTRLCLLEYPELIEMLSPEDSPIVEHELVGVMSDAGLFSAYFGDPGLAKRYELLKDYLKLIEVQPILLELFTTVCEVALKVAGRAPKQVDPKLLDYIRGVEDELIAPNSGVNISLLRMFKRLLVINETPSG